VKIALACGGTGGHIFPGIATAFTLRERGHDVTLWMAGKDVEHAAVKDWPGKVVTVAAKGFETMSVRAVGTVWKLMTAIRTCRKLMRNDLPDVMLAMGSYACVGPLGAARVLDIPYVLHESNVIPGRAVSLFANRAAAIGACFEETRYHLRRREIVITGMPLRKNIIEAAAQTRCGGDAKRTFTILVMGGSRGAHSVNEIVSNGIVRATSRGLKFRVIHLTGPVDEEKIRKRYADASVDADVRAFTLDMPALYAATDLAICRSGAATCAELSEFGVPALLIPYPHAARDHQMANARAMERGKAADVVPEHDLGAGWLARYLAHAIENPSRLKKMGEASRARVTGSGADALADLVEQMGSRRYARPR
jgi:UDP-N-acetylglucosamine--N-acetylmuramyl-(pentapeptide) pyrophosphoryl-undecaprenol N-acetylglucosamine transferase